MGEKVSVGVSWLAAGGWIALLAIPAALALLFGVLVVIAYLRNRLAKMQRVWARVMSKRAIDQEGLEEAATTGEVVASFAAPAPYYLLTAAAETVAESLKAPDTIGPVDYWITFVLESGKEVELVAHERDFYAIEEDQQGWLTYQGEWLKSFVPAQRPEARERQPASGIGRHSSVTPAAMSWMLL